MAKTLNLTLKVWRQENREAKGRIETYAAKDIPVDASFLEMLDIVNEGLVKEGKEPIHFDHDCREGICGMCSLTINGIPHGPERQVTTCQLHMRKFKDGDTVWIEPFRCNNFLRCATMRKQLSGILFLVQGNLVMKKLPTADAAGSFYRAS